MYATKRATQEVCNLDAMTLIQLCSFYRVDKMIISSFDVLWHRQNYVISAK